MAKFDDLLQANIRVCFFEKRKLICTKSLPVFCPSWKITIIPRTMPVTVRFFRPQYG